MARTLIRLVARLVLAMSVCVGMFSAFILGIALIVGQAGSGLSGC